jgi:hypothetical protein
MRSIRDAVAVTVGQDFPRLALPPVHLGVGIKKLSTEHQTKLTGSETKYTETELTENNFGA